MSRKKSRKLPKFAKQQKVTTGIVYPTSSPVDPPLPQLVSRVALFIEHPSSCVVYGVGLGVLLMTYPIPVLLLCFSLVLVAAQSSGIVSSESLFKRILRWGAVIIPTAAILWVVLLKATPWELQRSNPLFLDASVTSPEYVRGKPLAGLQWEPDYKEFTIHIDYDSKSYGIEKAEFEFEVNNGINIMGAAQDDGIANCRFSPSKEMHDGDSFSFDIDRGATRFGKKTTTTPLVLHPSRESVICDRLPAGTTNRVILALRGNAPSTLGVKGSYDLVDGDKIVRKMVDLKNPVQAY